MPHIHEQIDITVSAYIVHESKVLLRMHDKYDLWLPAGGHVELDEDPNRAVVREAKEETGYDIVLGGKSTAHVPGDPKYKNLVPPDFMNIHYADEPHQHMDLIYFASLASEEVGELRDEDKGQELRWFTAEELDNIDLGIEDMVKFYAKEALKKSL